VLFRSSVIAYFYEQIISKQTSTKRQYLVISVPGRIFTRSTGGRIDGYAPEEQKYCFISGDADTHTPAHELGHNLKLKHTGYDLGQCSESDLDCEQNVKTNNIMGYSNDKNSFWQWQKTKIVIKTE
jgi:hypothetical protein